MNERLSDERLKILEANFHPNAAAQRASVVGEEIYALAAEVIERRALFEGHPMHAFILEALVSSGWRRAGDTYWTLDDASAAARKILKRRLARRVRILPAEVGAEAVAKLPEERAWAKQQRNPIRR